jgi:lysozyme
MDMRMSENGKKLLSSWEGLELRAYRDVGGKLTIGVGHLLTQSEQSSGKIWIKGEPVRYDAGLSEQQALDLLAQDLEKYEAVINDCVEVNLNQNQFDALTSFCFNVGGNAFMDSTLLKLLNQGNYEAVPEQLRRWVYCNHVKIQGMVNRRENEIKLWLS